MLWLILAGPLLAQDRPDPAATAAAQYQQSLVSRLAAGGEAPSLALAALMQDSVEHRSASDPQARRWREAAFARAGADLATLTLVLAGAAEGEPVRDQAVARWRQIEPGNLAPWLFDPGAGVDDVLAAARTATQVDTHLYRQLRAIVAAVGAHPPSAEQAAVLLGGADRPGSPSGHAAAMGMGLLRAVPIPALQPLTDACREAIGPGPGRARAEDCRSAAALLARADTMLLRMVGLTLAESVAADAAGQRAAREARRHFDWQMIQWGRLSAGAASGGVDDLARLLLDPAIADEPALVERLLTDAGISLQPPAGWRPPSAGGANR